MTSELIYGFDLARNVAYHPTAGRGLFAGLQDVKHYNVDHGWAKRSQDQPQGLFSFLWSRFTGGAYRPPTDS
ncbi:hypothetical protein KXV22_005093 [Aspergillus fumigatus]|uniref:Uncharacterized protein n=1 Tax=Aspergillus fumigatus TaxID=746128 RepID=A0A9P8NNA5_ASPFM|nr:hypothetical protein KXX38_002578 [Aspergillus fumigatus]KAH1374906.1 hypothetical protein KXX10_002029 [Aspergillus fumigatus]KAH1420387.1 hypothetical protein KXX64_000830 [Aspergillus fumigatus]KAH1465766.1 hypothetical protein KXX13_002333 [Aspergillus fumigatus]KAH1502611.1 hypothetical protein KXX52_007120 [Aspergillus fumigatus]